MQDWPQQGLEDRVQRIGAQRGNAPVRGTQSFVRVMQWCWTHPSVTALEVLWRWIFGSFALWLIFSSGSRILSAATGGSNDLAGLGLDHLTVTDPMAAATSLVAAAATLLPLALPFARWLLPLLLLVWLVLSSLGRTAVLRRADHRLAVRPLTMAALQFVRIVALGGSLLVWFSVMQWASAVSITQPVAQAQEPRLVQYFALVIVGTLGLFTLWAVVSWALSLAPLLSVLRNRNAWSSLRLAASPGPLKMKLVEINLVMGIVKIALIVLAMVFSACPLPFQSVESPDFLFGWNVGVAVLYLLGSDFFHVVRQIAYLELWRAYEHSPAGDSR